MITADIEGNFSTTINVPKTAAVGVHPVVVQVAKPSAASVFEFKVSPDIKFSGADKFDILTKYLEPGLYQSAYSTASKALFVTSAVGHPPIKQSALIKVNPDSLKIETKVTPNTLNKPDQVMAVYGIAIDDDAGTVWVTNTHASTVAVYKQSDLSLVKQFPNGIAAHARDVAVDSAKLRAYISASGSNEIIVIDTQTLEPIKSNAIRSSKSPNQAIRPMSLTLDAKSNRLYTISRTTNEAIIIDLVTHKVELIYPLEGAKAPSGVAVASDVNILFVASQGSDTLQLVDLNEGKILHTVRIGANPLNVVWDSKNKLAYAVNRASDSIVAIKLDGKLVANLKSGSYPNHLSTDGKGTVYVINKSRGKDDPTGDRVSRISLK
ncbi:YncE family protein [Orrella sp. 11846]|uniref:YncE family protein n=1 Tax=Orrella sp. 11846 TaxID=3409913 RepID=UPI003B5BC5DC